MKALVKKILKDIDLEIEEEIYKFDRYNIKGTLCFFTMSENIKLNEIKNNLRKTDRVFKIENVYIIFFKYTELLNGIKAFQNLIFKLKIKTNKKVILQELSSDFIIHNINISSINHFKSVLTEITDKKTPYEIIYKLVQNLIISEENFKLV